MRTTRSLPSPPDEESTQHALRPAWTQVHSGTLRCNQARTSGPFFCVAFSAAVRTAAACRCIASTATAVDMARSAASPTAVAISDSTSATRHIREPSASVMVAALSRIQWHSVHSETLIHTQSHSVTFTCPNSRGEPFGIGWQPDEGEHYLSAVGRLAVTLLCARSRLAPLADRAQDSLHQLTNLALAFSVHDVPSGRVERVRHLMREVLSGTQSHSVALSGTHWHSEVIIGHHKPSSPRRASSSPRAPREAPRPRTLGSSGALSVRSRRARPSPPSRARIHAFRCEPRLRMHAPPRRPAPREPNAP